MPLLRRGPASRLDERMCLSCGYRGPDLQGERGTVVLQCPDCGEDLYSRPARSYHEMEGFVETEVESRPPVERRPSRSRWQRVIDSLASFFRRFVR